MKTILILLISLISYSALANDFAAFNKLLEKYVVQEISEDGFVSGFKYSAALKDPSLKKVLDDQSKVLANYNLETLDTKEKANAFYINAYNFFMIKTVLIKGVENGKLDIDSVKDLGSWINPYSIFKQDDHVIGGKKMSLDDIEKKTLLGEEFKRKGWKDARIHFAVNCASVGCPPLRKKVYKAEDLDKTLTENVELAMKTPRHMNIKGKTLNLTELFKWYKKDFVEAAGSVKGFVKKYVKDEARKNAVEKTTDISFIDYDWSLNKVENFPKLR